MVLIKNDLMQYWMKSTYSLKNSDSRENIKKALNRIEPFLFTLKQYDDFLKNLLTSSTVSFYTFKG